MKKIIFLLLLLVLIPTTALAQEDNTEILITSQPTEADIEEVHDLISGTELKTKTIIEIAELYKIDPVRYAEVLSEYYGGDIEINDSFRLLHDNYGLEPSISKEIAVAIRLKTEIPKNIDKEKGEDGEKKYHLVYISLVLFFLYLLMRILLKKKIITLMTHRKIWNSMLLITFLASGILGILLIIRINFGTIIPLPFNILFWHVEAGTAMFVMCIFHIIERWYFFKNMFKGLK